MEERAAELVIAGGGPAGMVAGLLFARAGVRTLVLEKHGDFLRDFRGDTVHPSTLRIFHELGLLEASQAGHLQSPWLAFWPTGQGVLAQLCVATICLLALAVTTLLRSGSSTDATT